MSVFQPDSFIAADVVPSPNHDKRKIGREPDMLLLHYTGMATAEAALTRLCTADSKVSAHYVVFEDGRIVQCVPEELRAWHAGVSSWGGETDINSCSIGIEIVNPGHEFGYPNFPLRQIAAVISLCRSILTRRGPINSNRILAHSDVRPAPLKLDGVAFKPGEHGDAIMRLQRVLRGYGYGIEETGNYDDAMREVITAFQRHFRQARVDGVADASTLLTLRALVETRPTPLA